LEHLRIEIRGSQRPFATALTLRGVAVTKIALLPERTAETLSWRAIAGEKQSVGRTAGEALDAITAQLNGEDDGTLIIMQSQRPDRFFTEQQQHRLELLMAKWRDARDHGTVMPSPEREELEVLVEAEVTAAALRAAAAFDTPIQ
jgi:hypothetical protein